ncbi:MAG: M48 family metallopeptidase [Candidatus Paceibacterota bacterium]
MLKHIEPQMQKVPYTLKVSARAKRLRLAIYCDGAFVVTAPRGIGEGMIEKYIIQKSQWIIEKLEYFKSISGTVFVRKSNKREYADYKERALVLARARLEYFNTFYNLKFNKVNIKNQKTRWGSCSRKGNLNFNYRIALLPPELADYIIVHELCHLKEFNHSRKFWNLVAQTVPNYLALRKELKKSGRIF